MEVSIRYNEVFEEDLVMALEWLKEEFELLFNSKDGKFTKLDKEIANNIIDYVLENTDVNGNVMLLNLLDETLQKIEEEYSNLFY